MDILTDLAAHTEVLRRLVGEGCDPECVPERLASLDDDRVVDVIREASAVVTAAESLRVAAAGIAAARSTRDRGHGGLSQSRGHTSAIALVQAVGGTTRSDAVRQVKVGEALLAGLRADDHGADTKTPTDTPPADRRPWHSPLDRALLHGTINTAQHHAILRGLGEPAPTAAPEAATTDAVQAMEAWRAAATQLIHEAPQRSVEELGAAARLIHDQLDPEGAQRRFDERFQRRSFRTWTDTDGVRHGAFVFDDGAAAWVDTILDAALRPRRGVRFVDRDEQDRAQQLADDPRTTAQLAHDLMVDVLRAGALASPTEVFGTRQAGVRLLITREATEADVRGRASIGCTEDGGTPLPGWLVATHACDAGTTTCTVDVDGNPLDVGREARLFRPAQKIALAVRDGGCRWPGCDRPASYCEAHHIDHWADGGSTDIHRGILLCRFHHMQLHHSKWRITRDGLGDFMLHPPGGGTTTVLLPRAARRYLWASSAPPPRFRPTRASTA